MPLLFYCQMKAVQPELHRLKFYSSFFASSMIFCWLALGTSS